MTAFNQFLHSADRAEALRAAWAMKVARVAYHGNDESFAKAMKELTRGAG